MAVLCIFNDRLDRVDCSNIISGVVSFFSILVNHLFAFSTELISVLTRFKLLKQTKLLKSLSFFSVYTVESLEIRTVKILLKVTVTLGAGAGISNLFLWNEEINWNI